MRAPAGTWLRTGAGLLLGVALFAGCSDDDPQAGELTPTPTTSSTTATPTPSATTPEQQVEGAVRTYYAELTKAAQTNDTTTLKTLTTKGCPCFRAAGVIDKNREQGETTPDASFVPTSVRIHDLEETTAGAEVRTEDSAYDVMRDGEVVDHIAAVKTHLDLSLIKTTDGHWVIANEVNLGG